MQRVCSTNLCLGIWTLFLSPPHPRSCRCRNRRLFVIKFSLRSLKGVDVVSVTRYSFRERDRNCPAVSKPSRLTNARAHSWDRVWVPSVSTRVIRTSRLVFFLPTSETVLESIPHGRNRVPLQNRRLDRGNTRLRRIHTGTPFKCYLAQSNMGFWQKKYIHRAPPGHFRSRMNGWERVPPTAYQGAHVLHL